MAAQGKSADADGMEDLIQKMLEKYGESEEHTDNVTTPEITASQDATKSTDTVTREADNSVNDMIRREGPRWDKAYGTEDNHTSASSTKETGRREIGRRPVPTTEDRLDDHVEIGGVIRSQTGVAKQLISVSEGLDEVNDDLEEMKRELKRIQTKTYTCLDGGDILAGQTAKEYVSVGGIREAGTYRGKNEWIEEREGVMRFSDVSRVQDTERYLKAYQVPVSKRDDDEMRFSDGYRVQDTDRYLKAYQVPVSKRDEDEMRFSDGYRIQDTERYLKAHQVPVSKRDEDEMRFSDGYRVQDTERYLKAHQVPVSKRDEDAMRFSDGYRVQDTERYLKAYQVPVSKLPGAGRAHIKESDIELTNLLTIADSGEPNWLIRSPADSGAVKRERYEVDRFGRPVTQYISVEESSSKHDDDRWRVKGSHAKSDRDGYCYMCEEFGDINSDRKSIPSNAVQHKIGHSGRHSPLSGPLLHQHSSHRSREDLGIYKTPSGVYFYSDNVGGFPNELNMAADVIRRTTVRQSSVPRFFQPENQPVASQRSLSQISRPNTGFTSRFLTKVRRRNSIGGRIDTERYRGQTLRSY